jgi:hypothetical protein
LVPWLEVLLRMVLNLWQHDGWINAHGFAGLPHETFLSIAALRLTDGVALLTCSEGGDDGRIHAYRLGDDEHVLDFFDGGAGPMHASSRSTKSQHSCQVRLWSYLRGVKDPQHVPDPTKALLHTEMAGSSEILGLFPIVMPTESARDYVRERGADVAQGPLSLGGRFATSKHASDGAMGRFRAARSTSRNVDLHMPRIGVEYPSGRSIERGFLVSWLVDVGEEVEVDQPIAEVASDYFDTEVPSPVAGVIRELRVSAGSPVSRGQVIAVLAVP